jgi:hypothetical protein
MENGHEEIIGSTGTGKSTYLISKILDHLDFPSLFIDPLGHNARDLISRLPYALAGRFCYIDLGDYHYSVGFDPIDEPQHLAPAIEAIYLRSWGERLDWRTFNSIGAVYETNRTLYDAYRMFFDDAHREKIVSELPLHSTYREFWVDQYAEQTEKYNREANEAVLNKFGKFLASRSIRAAYSVKNPPLSFEKALKHKYLIVLNLNVPVVGEKQAFLYASMFLSKFKTALQNNPTPCHAFLDEFQNYAAHFVPYFSSILRNFGLNLTLAHQLFGQLDDLARDAILTNMAVKTVFRTSPDDAEKLAPHFNRDPQEDFAPTFANLADYHYWQNDRGTIRRTTTHKPREPRTSRAHLLTESRARFAKPILAASALAVQGTPNGSRYARP